MKSALGHFLQYAGIGLFIIAVVHVMVNNSTNHPEPDSLKPCPETLYIKPPTQEQVEKVEWLYPPGNQRLNIPPNSGLEREWQKQHKTYHPNYTIEPVETAQ